MITCNNCSSNSAEDFKFCPVCGFKRESILICSSCNHENIESAKFCIECGQGLVKTRDKSINSKLNIEIPLPKETGFTIEFYYSASSTFQFAVNEARKFESFEQFGLEKKAVFRIHFEENEHYRVQELIALLNGWRNKTVYHNGVKVMWDKIFSYKDCYRNKLNSFIPERYCYGCDNSSNFNLWGCTRLQMNFVNTAPSWAYWFRYGKWLNSDGDWEYDKKKIKFELAKNIDNVQYCPSLNLEHIKEIIEALPAIVNPFKNHNWKLLEDYDKKPTSLKVEMNRHGFNDFYYFDGVGPNGSLFLKDIEQNLKRKLPNFITEFEPNS